MLAFLIRHGESTWNRTNRIQGSSNPALSPLGRRQADMIARRAAGLSFTHLVSSPLRRAKETGDAIARATGLSPQYMDGLKEISLGEWEGLTPASVNRRYRNGYAQWLQDPGSVHIPKAETPEAFRRRVCAAFDDLASRHADGDVVGVVTHGGVITAVLSGIWGAALEPMLIRLQIDNAGITQVRVHPGGAVVLGVNDTSHLNGTRALPAGSRARHETSPAVAVLRAGPRSGERRSADRARLVSQSSRRMLSTGVMKER